MEYTQIRYEPGRVARVVLNRPRYRNAQSRVLLEEMDDAFNRSVADNDVRVIVLSGEGDHFSAGHDLGTPDEMADREARGYHSDRTGRYDYVRRYFLENTLRWRNLPKPTIAMVQGYCIFGGWMIATAMDVIFASEDALFLPSHFQYFATPWDIGARKAKEVMFEHRFLGAAEAREQGLVNRVYPRGKLEEETLAYAGRVADNDPFSVRMSKFSINHMMDVMGFSAEVEVAYQTYFISRHVTWGADTPPPPPPKDYARVGTALKNLELSKGQL